MKDRWLEFVPYPLSAAAIVAWVAACIQVYAFLFPSVVAPGKAKEYLEVAGVASLALGGPFLVLFAVWRKRLYRFSEAEFFGLWWRWDYSFWGRIENLRPMCRVCKEPIEFPSGISRYLLADNHLCGVCGHDTFTRTKEKIPKKDIFGDVRALITNRRRGKA